MPKDLPLRNHRKYKLYLKLSDLASISKMTVQAHSRMERGNYIPATDKWPLCAAAYRVSIPKFKELIEAREK